jgi:hypothetical protein
VSFARSLIKELKEKFHKKEPNRNSDKEFGNDPEYQEFKDLYKEHVPLKQMNDDWIQKRIGKHDLSEEVIENITDGNFTSVLMKIPEPTNANKGMVEMSILDKHGDKYGKFEW